MTASEIFLDNLPSIIAVIVAMIPSVWLLIQKIIDKRQDRLDTRERLNYLDKLSLVMNNTKLIQGEVIRLYKDGKSDSEIMSKMKDYIIEHKINEINMTTYMELIQWQLERIHMLEVK